MFIPKMKKIQLWFVDVAATVKYLQVTPLIFTKNSCILRCNKKLLCNTFGAAEPNSISAKRNQTRLVDIKKKF